jgi:hypothetical protein
MELTTDRGGVAELAIALAASELGVVVLRPVLEGRRYDLVFDMGDRLWRVQCKSATVQGDVVVSRLRTWRRGPAGPITTTYTADEIDAVAVYCHDLRRVFLLPVDEVAGLTTVHLRLAAARNSQTRNIRMADEYDLAKMVGDPGAIAQLGERRAGSAKVVGSSPTSSTL